MKFIVVARRSFYRHDIHIHDQFEFHWIMESFPIPTFTTDRVEHFQLRKIHMLMTHKRRFIFKIFIN